MGRMGRVVYYQPPNLRVPRVSFRRPEEWQGFPWHRERNRQRGSDAAVIWTQALGAAPGARDGSIMCGATRSVYVNGGTVDLRTVSRCTGRDQNGYE